MLEDDFISWFLLFLFLYKLVNFIDDLEWERFFFFEIMVLLGKRNCVVLWVDSDDEFENNDSDIFVKI